MSHGKQFELGGIIKPSGADAERFTKVGGPELFVPGKTLTDILNKDGGEKMNYEESSDYEINRAVAMFEGFYNFWNEDDSYCNTGRKGSVMCAKSQRGFVERNYCDLKNPSDAWTIIIENKISLVNGDYIGLDSDVWEACMCIRIDDCGSECDQHKDKNPARAAMIVFLKMQELK